MVGALNQIRQKRETPRLLFCDNGSELTSQIIGLWAYHNRVQIDFSRPLAFLQIMLDVSRLFPD